MNSRICVKNLPKHVSEKRFREHFSKIGEITDCKIIKKEGRSRLFGFIGYLNENDAKSARVLLNNTYFDTSKIIVEKAMLIEDDSARPWSKYSKGSSAYDKTHKTEGDETKETKPKKVKTEEKPNSKTRNDPEFKRFLQLMEPRTKRPFWQNDDEVPDQKKKESDDENEEKPKEVVLKKRKVIDESGTKSVSVISSVPNKKAGGKGLTLKKIHVKFENEEEQKEEESGENVEQQIIKSEVFEKDDVINNPEVSDLDYLKSRVVTNNMDFDSDDDFKIKKEDEVKVEKEEEKNDKTVNKGNEKNSDNNKDKNKESNSNPEIEEETLGETGRLFVRNLSFSTTEEDLKKLFSKYGPISELHIPIDTESKRPKGFAFVLYLVPQHALTAFEKLDGKFFQGRILHLIPAKAAPIRNDFIPEYLSYKKKKELETKANSNVKRESWNSLFMRSDAVVSSLAERYNMTSGDLLDPSVNNLAVRVSLMETHIINETKKYLESEGVVLDDLLGDKTKIPRSPTIILVKNIPHTTQMREIYNMFGTYGTLGRVLLPPAKTMALVEFLEPSEARKAFKNLAYTKFKHVPLYLEWAPLSVLKGSVAPSNIPVQKVGQTNKSIELQKSTETKQEESSESGSESESEKDKAEEKVKGKQKEEEEESKYSSFQNPTKPQKQTNNNNNNNNNSNTNVTPSTKDNIPNALPKISIPNPTDTKTNTPNDSISQEQDNSSSTLFVKNISWDTNEETLSKLFSEIDGFVNFKLGKKKDVSTGKWMSMGFGFASYRNKENAIKALKSLQGKVVDNYQLELKFSEKSSTPKHLEKRPARKEEAPQEEDSKIVVKNLPFQATKQDIFDLFKVYGQIKKVRVPKKPSGEHRGFAFVEFLTLQSAQNAIQALKNTHLYGRHLVVQYASKNENLEQLREKTAKQFGKL